MSIKQKLVALRQFEATWQLFKDFQVRHYAKRGPTAYNVFVKEQYPLKKSPGEGLKEVAPKISAAWKALTQLEKESYVQKSKELQKEVTQVDQTKVVQQKAKKAKGKDTAKKEEKKEKKEKGQPRGFSLYVKEKYYDMKAQHANSKMQDIIKLLAEKWQKMTDIEKNAYKVIKSG
eukprot:TRINITY_DN2224_c1_g1_i1.p1 TRINITY_DN2224_c1_g1~~TRINITY_DN2224_c1_g1_i1.p1  ORF type:complete len:196 (+),score=30.00 TRINITY_DN2224_c1_g1_i1:66-590(+)